MLFKETMKQSLSPEDIERTGRILADVKNSLAVRFRALFTLRNTPGSQSIEWISKVLLEDPSPLLKHECAFCLGQMKDPRADEVLKQVLANKQEHCMVRHEAGEALAAIGSLSSLDFLKQYTSDDVIEVAQTCQLGVKKIELENISGDQERVSLSIFNSVDPTSASNENDVLILERILSDPSQDLFDRYQALFALRNLMTEDAVNALGRCLLSYQNDDNNNLLKHEIAYVFGQLKDEKSVCFLKETLSNMTENEMVRHEAAEALGSIASDEASTILESFKNDPVSVVKESIEVALDMNEYERSTEFNFIE